MATFPHRIGTDGMTVSHDGCTVRFVQGNGAMELNESDLRDLLAWISTNPVLMPAPGTDLFQAVHDAVYEEVQDDFEGREESAKTEAYNAALGAVKPEVEAFLNEALEAVIGVMTDAFNEAWSAAQEKIQERLDGMKQEAAT